MTELDPYAVLGVTRAATRDEIARAYRRLAKMHHPDSGAAPSVTMGRINEAWHVLSDAVRRARWDRDHSVVLAPHWAARPEVRPQPAARPVVPPSRLDSGWLAVGVVGIAAVVVLAVLLAIGLTSPAVEETADGYQFSSGELSFTYSRDWQAAAGVDDGESHRVIAHVATFDLGDSDPCTSFDAPCELSGDAVPPGEASVVITLWTGGTPPVPEPVRARPYGLDAQRMIGDAPAAFRLERHNDDAVAWWQLSPPGFPDQWIEVRADIGGRELEQTVVLGQIEEMLRTVEFGS